MTIGEFNNRLARKFRGASLDDIQGISDFSIYSEAAGNVLSKLDPYETVRLHRFTVFDGIEEYSPPSDLKGKKIIDPAPQDGGLGEEYNQVYTKPFRRDGAFYQISVQSVDGSKVLKLRGPGKGSSRVDDTTSITNWSAAGGATNLELEQVITLDNSYTLRVDLGATGGYIENSSVTSIDLSSHEDIGSFFRKVYFPTLATASVITSITLRIGSSSADYWEITGECHFGSFKAGTNIVRFDWADATETGTPDATAIDYERLTFVTTAAVADTRIGPLASKIPFPYETPYYSNCLFRTSAGLWLDEPTSTSDELVLERESENIFFYESCALVAEDLSLDEEAIKFRKKLGIDELGNLTNGGLYGEYNTDKPAEALRPQGNYITFRNRRTTRRSIFRE